ncbi:putative 3-hydroxybutyryl-CoA dehydrogenase [Desulfosporosinus acididurans]|uniref:3-hydroxybutyryl-CoA dehydrogenase n=1 Tax=Desulfosporosinus acididurans TaxID=476652 RepID=A0A0J1FMW4_9FIRM|nr:3-hydroxyacyl-CoA dehydrogenase family protein [Desulfosporosinus acididurans]KLU64815.1 putative 3-hydroxybutyryl-CoA dehydrogenase [Desulfosporosinus acididurans]
MTIKKIGVLGAGAMGGGIAHLAAQKGFEVVLCDVDMKFVEAGVAKMTKLMDKSITKGKITAEDKEAILARITKTTNLEDFAEVDFFIEAIIEDLDIKKTALAKVDKILRPEVIMGSNTSSMSITALAASTSRPDKFLGTHFFNPAQVMRLCELIRGAMTSDETMQRAADLASALGKTSVEVKKDTPGFIVNRCMMPQFLEAIRLVDEGVATPQDIDTAVKMGLNYPMGPFELMDLTGIDIAAFVTDYFYAETGRELWKAPHALKSMIRAGRLGDKTGAGWYTDRVKK